MLGVVQIQNNLIARRQLAGMLRLFKISRRKPMRAEVNGRLA
jgi:hypothetical protein